MSQINLHVTPAFEDDLALLMKEFRTRNKSQAIRIAVHTTAKYARQFAAIEARERAQRDRQRDAQCAAGTVETGAPDGSE